MYQLSRLMRGNARSFAPIIIGTRKFPSVAGIDGIRKKNTIVTPCIVKNLLYVSASTRSPRGVSNSSRISIANTPPRKKNSVMPIRYRMAMRLWSLVSSHELSVCPSAR